MGTEHTALFSCSTRLGPFTPGLSKHQKAGVGVDKTSGSSDEELGCSCEKGEVGFRTAERKGGCGSCFGNGGLLRRGGGAKERDEMRLKTAILGLA